MSVSLAGRFGVDPYLFPPRGRKRFAPGYASCSTLGNVDPYLFPARGRKLMESNLFCKTVMIQPVKESRGTVATLSKPTPEAGWIDQE